MPIKECENCGEKSVELIKNAVIERCSSDGCNITTLIDTLKTEQEMVKEFHIRNKFPVDELLTDKNHNFPGVKEALDYIAAKLKVQVDSIKNSARSSQILNDERLYRVYLMLEELMEVIEAMANNDEVELADGLGDLQYVLLGTAVAYSIPMKEVFEEIQKANMAKKQRDPKINPRMRDKGEGWQRPDIKSAIERGRKC